MKPTVDDMDKVLAYDPETGVLSRKATGRPTGTLNGMGYLVVNVLGGVRAAHRVAWLLMTGSWPTQQIDHVDGCRVNNRWSNLRGASNQENQRNRKLSRKNRAGLKGVCLTQGGKARAFIQIEGRTVYLGTFLTAERAHAAYVRAARESFGEFARAQ